MFCTPVTSCLLRLISENIQVNKGHAYFLREQHVGQPCYNTRNAFMGRCIVTNPYNKTKSMREFLNLFWNETLHVSDNSFVHHQEFFTVHTAMAYVIQVCRQLSSRIRTKLQFHPEPHALEQSILCNCLINKHCCAD